MEQVGETEEVCLCNLSGKLLFANRSEIVSFICQTGRILDRVTRCGVNLDYLSSFLPYKHLHTVIQDEELLHIHQILFKLGFIQVCSFLVVEKALILC